MIAIYCVAFVVSQALLLGLVLQQPVPANQAGGFVNSVKGL